MLNRRRDEDDPAEHRVSVFAISVFASCHWRKKFLFFLSLQDETVLCWDLTAINKVQLQNTEKEQRNYLIPSLLLSLLRSRRRSL